MTKLNVGWKTWAELIVVVLVIVGASNYINSGGKTVFGIAGGAPGSSIGNPGTSLGYSDYNPSAITGCAQAPSGAVSVITPDLTKLPVNGPNGQLVYPLKLQATGVNAFAQYPTHSTLASIPAFGSSSTGASSVNGLSLGVGYLLVAGEQSTILQNATKINPGCNLNVPANILALAYSAPVVLVANTVQNIPTANTILRNQGAGANTITFQFFVKGGTNFASEGPLALSIADNSLAFPTCPSIGFPLTTTQVPAMTYVTTNTGAAFAAFGIGAASTGALGVQNQQCNYLIPSTYGNLYSNPAGGFAGTPSISSTGGTYQLNVQSAATLGANEVISFMVTPATCSLNTVNGTEVCGLYKNQVTGATLVSPVGTGIVGGISNVVIIAQP